MYKILAVHTKTVTDGQTKELAIDITGLNNKQEPINVTPQGIDNTLVNPDRIKVVILQVVISHFHLY